MMRFLGLLGCAMLLAGCTSGALQQSASPTHQEFGYPRVQSLPLPPLAPAAAAPVPATPSPVAAAPTATAPAAAVATLPASAAAAPTAAATPPQASVAVVPPQEAAYDEKKDPIMRNLLAQATSPVNDDANMVNGKLVLPPTAKLDIIDIRDVSETLRAAAPPPS